MIGCHLAAATLDWCEVLGDRWVFPHHAVRTSFRMGLWTTRACKLVRITPYGQLPGLLFWMSLGISRSTEVGRIWDVYDEFLQVVPLVFSDGIWSALGADDVSCAWRFRSFAAEVSLLSAFQLAGGPIGVSSVVVV